MVNPAGAAATAAPSSSPEQRLAEAYRRYDRAYQDARPGTLSAVELARARMDLVLLLEASGELLSDTLIAQVRRDADSILVTTVALPIEA